jgi:pyruvate-ferredoxin/flavodoxin oxidoreductase
MVGRQYHLFDYVGAADAERVIIMMGSGVGAAEEAVDDLVGRGEKVGLLKVRLFGRLRWSAFPQGVAADREERLRCWIARKSRERSASRSTRM